MTRLERAALWLLFTLGMCGCAHQRQRMLVPEATDLSQRQLFICGWEPEAQTAFCIPIDLSAVKPAGI